MFDLQKKQKIISPPLTGGDKGEGELAFILSRLKGFCIFQLNPPLPPLSHQGRGSKGLFQHHAREIKKYRSRNWLT